jgi:hypothetical protein
MLNAALMLFAMRLARTNVTRLSQHDQVVWTKDCS